jgi:serine/threonine-protein kinase
MTRIGRYDTLGVLGGGGMATVYVGRAVGAGGFERLVAIKVMHPHLAVDPEFVAMFLDEARLAARIRHPNVVATIDVHQGTNDSYLVMDYVEGPSLDAMLRALRGRSAPLPLDIALRIFHDLLGGLHAAHELHAPDGSPLGVVHRDVSPQNVLVGTDGVTRITDFGVAQAAARLASTKFGHIKGKLAYAPPEAVLLEPLDRRADLYAAGAVLWEMLTGKPLFESDNELTLGGLVLDGVKQRPRDLVPAVPEAIDAVCMRALEQDREKRFSSAAEMSDALDEASSAAGVPVASPRAVAAFVKQLGAHRPAPEGTVTRSLPPLATTRLETPAPSATPRSRAALVAAAAVVAVVGAASWVLSRPDAPGSASPVEPARTTPTTSASADPAPSATTISTAGVDPPMPTASTSARPSSTGSGKRPRDVVVPPPGPGKFRPKDL